MVPLPGTTSDITTGKGNHNVAIFPAIENGDVVTRGTTTTRNGGTSRSVSEKDRRVPRDLRVASYATA